MIKSTRKNINKCKKKITVKLSFLKLEDERTLMCTNKVFELKTKLKFKVLKGKTQDMTSVK